jgi:hypothetical protein
MLKFHINQFAVVKIHRGVIIIMQRYRYGISDANEPSLNAETEDDYHRVLQLRMRVKHGVTANNMETTFHT